MATWNLYSKRQKNIEGKGQDVFTYDKLPQPLRVQIVHTWNDAIGFSQGHYIEPENLFREIEKILLREYGVFKLVSNRDHHLEPARNAVEQFFLTCSDVNQCLDIVELVFHAIGKIVANNPYRFNHAQISAEDAVEDLNQRFREHSVGYIFSNSKILRIDSQLIHAEVVIPALTFLAQDFLAGADQEFINAHKHFRHGRYKECLVECCKAFESTMKSICDKRKWPYDSQKDTAKDLIDICISNNLVPRFLNSHLTSLRTMLESGLPTVRNKLGRHGQGSKPIEVPEEVASYALHLTAANILLLATSEAKLP